MMEHLTIKRSDYLRIVEEALDGKFPEVLEAVESQRLYCFAWSDGKGAACTVGYYTIMTDSSASFRDDHVNLSVHVKDQLVNVGLRIPTMISHHMVEECGADPTLSGFFTVIHIED